MGGIIPACAGNTKATTVETSLNGDHPRMRGEHQSGWYPNTETAGSSPHARGTLSPVPHPQVPTGIIPACAGNTGIIQGLGVTGRDHPRMRGEHIIERPIRYGESGSSPHARGTHTAKFTVPPDYGIIPACAGNTTSHDGKTCPHPYHPRMRGEHDLRGRAHDMDAGSSPHARGTLTNAGTKADSAGIIPACAGNTASASILRLNPRDHPRMRGEHEAGRVELTEAWGSSPHARGTLGRTASRIVAHGIIPACAGNTMRIRPVLLVMRDHPRMRGEHAGLARLRPVDEGSSPHARGTQDGREDATRSGGIIPACAGNTFMLLIHIVRLRDHPRMRGEHYAGMYNRDEAWGSSPHARGTQVNALLAQESTGIIPACAGNTIRLTFYPPLTWDHPRMRGEHRCVDRRRCLCRGSSPHARGTHGAGDGWPVAYGIIPACAGNTARSGRASAATWDHPRMRGEHRACSPTSNTAKTTRTRDHPRMRGEHSSRYAFSSSLTGSSPHARGTQLSVVQPGFRTGIIPACAGNTGCQH